ncbi:MAG: hypothetical protein GX434_00380 [Peptococcaceae bacterium]|nr:hypothetical protein [Peptococcaceae bacterium]
MKVLNKKNVFLTTILTVALILTPLLAGSVLAKPIEKIKAPLIVDVSQDVKDNFSSKVLNSERLKKFQYNFDVDSIRVKQFPKEYGDMTAVYVPIKDNTGYNYSNYIELFDKEGNLDNYLLLAFSKQENNIYHFTMQTREVKGEFNISESGEIIDSSATDANGTAIDLSKITPKMDTTNSSLIQSGILSHFSIKQAAYSFWDCMRDCLSSYGVASWMISAILAACSLCAAAPLCVICIAACFAGLGSIAQTCVTSCWAYEM